MKKMKTIIIKNKEIQIKKILKNYFNFLKRIIINNFFLKSHNFFVID